MTYCCMIAVTKRKISIFANCSPGHILGPLKKLAGNKIAKEQRMMIRPKFGICRYRLFSVISVTEIKQMCVVEDMKETAQLC